MAQQQPTPQQTTDKDRCKIELTGYVECCCDGGKVCYRYDCITAPCGIDPEGAKAAILQWLSANPTAHLHSMNDFGRLGWLIWFAIPVPCPEPTPPAAR